MHGAMYMFFRQKWGSLSASVTPADTCPPKHRGSKTTTTKTRHWDFLLHQTWFNSLHPVWDGICEGMRCLETCSPSTCSKENISPPRQHSPSPQQRLRIGGLLSPCRCPLDGKSAGKQVLLLAPPTVTSLPGRRFRVLLDYKFSHSREQKSWRSIQRCLNM